MGLKTRKLYGSINVVWLVDAGSVYYSCQMETKWIEKLSYISVEGIDTDMK